jgi:signal transduction histidine kinase
MAARAVSSNPTLVERGDIERALHGERALQVRQYLITALETLDATGQRAPETPAAQAREISEQAYIRALRNVTEGLLHQLTPLIGDIEQIASREIANFEISETKKRIEQIKLQVEAITKIYHAAKPPAFDDFDLAAAIKNCLPDDLDHSKCSLSWVGLTPAMIQSDPSLVTIAVSCGLRNAVEACLSVATDEFKPSIVVTWNVTDRDCLISILDEGIGYAGSIEGAFEIGTTSKPGHSGHGLPNIKAAMLSLSGSVELTPQKDRGCSLILTWPIIQGKK